MRSCTIRVEAIIGKAATISTTTATIALSHQMLFLIIEVGMSSQIPRCDAAPWSSLVRVYSHHESFQGNVNGKWHFLKYSRDFAPIASPSATRYECVRRDTGECMDSNDK